MARLELRLFIEASPEHVWQVLADLPNQKAWMEDLHNLEITSGQESGPGTTVDVTSELFKVPVVKDKMVVTAWEPPYRFDVDHVGQFSGTGSFQLEPVAHGTVFTWIEDFAPPLGPVGEMGFRMVIGPHLRRVFTRSMNNVKRLAEQAQASAQPG